MFLVFIDIGRYFPPVTGSPLHVLISICQPAFLLTFAWYRVICWWKVSHTLWGDIRHVLKSGKAEEHRPGKSFCFYVYLFLNLVLGILQIYWFGIILLATKDVLSGWVTSAKASHTKWHTAAKQKEAEASETMSSLFQHRDWKKQSFPFNFIFQFEQKGQERILLGWSSPLQSYDASLSANEKTCQIF